MKSIYFCFSVIVIGCLAFLFQARAEVSNNMVVLELFTSQGCSSCPPADKNLAEFAKKEGVLALSFHVDYWNRLGWEDPFSKPEFTDRQKRYAAAMRANSLFTPQMVAGGLYNVSGFRTSEIQAAIDELKKMPSYVRLDIIAKEDGIMDVQVQALSSEQSAEEREVWLIVFDRVHETRVTRGENSGSILKNVNVVRESKLLGYLEGNSKLFSLDRSAIGKAKTFAILVQQRFNRRIIAAARFEPDV